MTSSVCAAGQTCQNFKKQVINPNPKPLIQNTSDLECCDAGWMGQEADLRGGILQGQGEGCDAEVHNKLEGAPKQAR